jgi:phage terminase large subunit
MSVKRNEVFRPYFESTKKYNILRGGSGSGKSYAGVDDYIIRTLESCLSRTIVARKVGATLRQSIFKLITSRIYDMGLQSAFTINKTEMTFTAGKNELILVGLDDVNKLKSIYDPTDALIEEADQISQNDFEEIDRRIRSITGRPPKITLMFNPTSVYSWLKKYFYDTESMKPYVYELTTTYKDNCFLDPAYAATIERLQETNPSAYRVYGLGEWGIVEGVVFPSWQIADIPHEAKSIGYGLDFGYTNDPTALIEVFETPEAYYYDEMAYRTGLTNPEISETMKECGISRYAEIIADSSEPKSIDELHRMGWNIKPCVKGADSIRHGITAMKSKKQFVTPRSSNLQREFRSYSWKQDKNGRWLEEPIDMFNHGIDAIRYRVDSRSRIIRAGTAAGALGL